VHNRYRSSLPSGEDRVVDQESAALAGAGWEVERFERLSDQIPGLPLAQKLAIPARVVWNPSAARELSRTIESFRPDIVHVHNVYPLLSPSVLQACRNRAPVVVTFHNYRPICPTGELFRAGSRCTDCVGRVPVAAVRHGCYRGSTIATAPLAVASLVQRRLWRSVPSAYVFLSAAQRQLFSTVGLPGERCFVKGNLVHPSVGTTPTESVVAYVGRLDERKGVRLLMDAWDRCQAADEGGPLRLVVAGAGPLEPLVQSWAEQHSNVEFLGLLGREDCSTLMQRARAVVVPSTYDEPFGLVVAESMAAGTPPIAPAHGAFPELISDGVDGVLFPSGDADALSGLLTRVGRNPAWFDGLGRAAKRTHARRFAPEHNVAELVDIYRFAIDHPVGIGRTPELVTAGSA
jgi:glycosyltransferase involved in cell wall biosynthesis